MEMPFRAADTVCFPQICRMVVGGGIAQGDGFEPSDKGTVVYLNGGDDLNIPLARIERSEQKF